MYKSMLSRMFLVHSYLYYQMNESVIDDTEYDMICDRLKKTKGSDYYACDLIDEHLESEASGYTIKRKDYPPEIISSAVHLLYQERFKDKPFNEFLSMYGHKCVEKN
tara:strand:+ start:320 stop:640 length:321 start_codon:yes stop_codon:yes gene_type:complete